jgi:hypothetical protein
MAKLQPVLSKKELLCVWGKFAKTFKMSLVSNQEATFDEFHAFQKARVKGGKKMLTKQYCDAKLR